MKRIPYDFWCMMSWQPGRVFRTRVYLHEDENAREALDRWVESLADRDTNRKLQETES